MVDLFSKTLGSILVAVANDSNAIDKVEMAGGKFIGKTTSDDVFTYGDQTISISDALNAYESKLEPIFPTMAADAKMSKDIELFNTDKTFKASNIIVAPAKPKVIIPVFPGTNCEYDTARAFERAGAEAKIQVICNQNQEDISNSLKLLAKNISESNIVMLPGGFSAGGFNREEDKGGY